MCQLKTEQISPVPYQDLPHRPFFPRHSSRSLTPWLLNNQNADFILYTVSSFDSTCKSCFPRFLEKAEMLSFPAHKKSTSFLGSLRILEHCTMIAAAGTNLMNRNLQFNFLSTITTMIILSQPNSANTLSTIRTAPKHNIYDSIGNDSSNRCITEGRKLRQKCKQPQHTKNRKYHQQYSSYSLQFHISAPSHSNLVLYHFIISKKETNVQTPDGFFPANYYWCFKERME